MPDRPHILLITADQFRWDCLHCLGNEAIRTPNLDRIARDGVAFRNGFSPNPICVPARATIMTGNYPQVCTGIKTNGGRIRDGQPLLTEVLKAVGYRTYALGKLHFVPYSPPGKPRLVHGFEHVDLHESGRLIGQYDPQGKLSGLEDYADYLKTVGWGGYTRAHGIGNNDVRPAPSPLPAEHYVDHWIADCTLRQIDRHLADRPDQPFFMWMSSPKPHSPYDPPRPYDAMYDPRDMPLPAGSPELLGTRHPGIDRTRFTHGLTSLSPQAWQVIRSHYYGSITFLDAMIGRVLDRLETKGILDRTIIVFTADHGDLLGDFGSAFKSNHLNGSVRVPFLAMGPGIARGRVSEGLVGLQDILPTFAALAGADIGQQVQGHDLSAHLADPSVSVRGWYYATTGEPPTQSAMIANGQWKYIYNEANGSEELYDQVNDPLELQNLAGDDPDRLADLRQRLRREAQSVDDVRLLARDSLAATPYDFSHHAGLPIGGMGWRWY